MNLARIVLRAKSRLMKALFIGQSTYNVFTITSLYRVTLDDN